MKTVLLIEDDYALAMGTEYTLKAEGYEVIHAKNLKEARGVLGIDNDNGDKEISGVRITPGSSDDNESFVSGQEVSIILLDVMLPDGDGFSFLEEMIQNGVDIPVIFSTAVGDEANIVRGLDLGADDYITKPYKVKEMLSRIAAVLRRQERAARMSGYGDNNIRADQTHQGYNDLSDNDYIHDFGSHTFNIREFRLYKNGELVDCTPAELRLLRELVINRGIVITRNQLMQRLYDTENTFIDDNTLSVYIKRLRDKLEDDAGYINTVKGIGYRFEK